MKKHTVRHLYHGREVRKHLGKVAYGHSIDTIFHDWLDLMLASHLSFTDNMARPDFVEKFKANKLDGIYEDRYMEIVKRYDDGGKLGERPIDHFKDAFQELQKEVASEKVDVLGEIYMAMITFGQHGQFFTPQHISEMMASIVNPKDEESVYDPCCGSGQMLIEAGIEALKHNRKLKLHGNDIDPRCAKMCALNMMLFGFDAVVTLGDSLAMTFSCEWRISTEGLIWERELKMVAEKPRQEELFAA
jgi:type I restriction-modification system DNA methylase subunit